MKSLVLSRFPMIFLTTAALLLFFGFFCAMVARVSNRRHDAEFTHLSRLPLEEGQRHDDER